jgi:UPF0271 protein
MSITVNMNADMGEGFGAYDIGDDDGILKIIRSASIACGFHAGDPNTMRRVVQRAKEEGCSIGAHPGFNDLWGFGRRQIKMSARDLEYMTAYQIGALQAIAKYSGLKVTHLKAHGALNNMAHTDTDYAMAIGRAIKTVDPSIIYVAPYGSEMEVAARKLDLPLAREGFADRAYEDNGQLASRGIPGTVYKDPAKALEQCRRIIEDKVLISRHGNKVKMEVETICLHGDEPTAVMVAGEVKRGLDAAGIKLVTLPEMLGV